MGLRAICAFWKPFSARSVGNLDDQEIKAIALTSIEELEKQIEIIRTTFGIEKPRQTPTITRTDLEEVFNSCISKLNLSS